jgi:hypothetical protein
VFAAGARPGQRLKERLSAAVVEKGFRAIQAAQGGRVVGRADLFAGRRRAYVMGLKVAVQGWGMALQTA